MYILLAAVFFGHTPGPSQEGALPRADDLSRKAIRLAVSGGRQST